MNDDTSTRRPRGRPKATWKDEPAAPVQALDRGLTILNALAERSATTLTELAQATGLPASSAHRLLATLQRHGYATFDEARQTWSVGLQSFRVGAAFAQSADLVGVGRRVMRPLMQDTGETANLGLADGTEVVFISQIETPNPIRAFFPIGARGPMHASGIGKALLAEMSADEVARAAPASGLTAYTATTLTTPAALAADLEATRRRGYAVDDEERHAGMRCVAAAVRNAHGEALAGVSVSGPKARLSDAVVPEIGAKVMAAAREISRQVGGG